MRRLEIHGGCASSQGTRKPAVEHGEPGLAALEHSAFADPQARTRAFRARADAEPREAATRPATKARSRSGRGGGTHICKLGYYVLALVVSVEAVPGTKVFGSRYRLLVVGGIGTGIYM